MSESKENKNQVKQEVNTIEHWANLLRIPSWQLAALKKYKNYAARKSVTLKEFETDLKNAISKKF